MTTIRIDHANNGETFWHHLTDYDVIHMAPIGDEARAAAARLCEAGVQAVTLSDPAAAELEEWFAALPGWHGGPDHAPHPVLFHPAQ